MATVNLFVGLKIPDNTAISAFHTLEKMGCSLRKLERETYYEFIINGDPAGFMERIVKADVLVNHNKNSAYASLGKDDRSHDAVVLVENIDEDFSSLLHLLRERLGFSMIESVKKGVYWRFFVERGDSHAVARKAAEELLANRHYQTYKVI